MDTARDGLAELISGIGHINKRLDAHEAAN